MYNTRRRSKIVPVGESEDPSAVFSSVSSTVTKSKKSPQKKSVSPLPRKKPKNDMNGLFQDKVVYIVPVELPKARRDLLTKLLEDNGGSVRKDFSVDAEKSQQPDYIVVDDRVHLDTLCRTLDKEYPTSTRLLPLLNGTSVVRAKWLSACFRAKKIVDDAEGKINDFLENHILAVTRKEEDTSGHLAEEKDEPLRKHFSPTPYRDQTPDRHESYHSDDDHKSVASDASHLDGDITDEDDQSPESPKGDDRRAGRLKKNNFFLSAAGPKKTESVNQHIIDQLEEMMTTYRNIGDEFRTYAYARAISSIRKYPDPILGMEQIKDLKNVGPRIAAHILEIIETGHFEKSHESSLNEDTAAMNRFVNIHGVGTKTAKKWVQMGMRTLEDVKSNVPLTAEQTVGLKYYEEFREKMSRKEVEEIVAIVEKTVCTIKAGFIFQVCGSYRRGRDLCGDVDLLMTHPDGKSHETILKPLIDRLHDMKFLTDDLFIADQRHKKYLGVCRLPKEGAKHRRLDIIIPPYKDWATCVLGWTGSMYFVRSIRDYAHKQGMSLTDYSLNKNVIRVNGEKVDEGQPMDTPTEEAIFQALNLPYLRPEERDH